jgi:Pvc16 N-terminal domain
MATPNAIAAIGQAILSLIAAGVPHDEFASAKFDLYQAKDFQAPMEEGVSLYLYRVTPAGEIRNYPPRIAPDGRKFKQLLPINLHYILSAWAREAVKQQRLLGWAMRILEDTPVLPSGVLNQGGPESDTFRSTETVDLIMETISVYDMGAIWDVSKPNVQPSVGYVARMLGLESQLEVTEAPAVQTRVFREGKVLQP